MKFIRKLSLLLCTLMVLQMFMIAACAEEDTQDISVTGGCRGIDSAVPYLSGFHYVENAQSVFLFESTTDTLMYGQNQDQQLHPSGLVKIMTALVAIENGNLSDVVTAGESVIDSISSDARTSKIQPDEIFTVEQLLYCVMVEGSNDGAALLADHIAGSQEAFVKMMNDRAEQMGCTNTVFTNVHGLHDVSQLSTARDIARILDVAIENEMFRTLFGTTHYTIEKTNKSEERNLESSNHMLHEGMYEIYYDERVTGGRTGVNNTGLRCIATTSKQHDMELICVVMGSESKINDRGIVEQIGGFYETSQLLDIGFDGTRTAQILYEGQSVKQCTVLNGSCDVVLGVAADAFSVVPQNATTATFDYRYNDIEGAFTAPISKGQVMSKLEIWNGNVCIAQADLYAMGDVDVNYQQIIRDKNKGLSAWAIILIVILVIMVGTTVALYIVRFYNIRQRKAVRRSKRRTVRRQEREM